MKNLSKFKTLIIATIPALSAYLFWNLIADWNFFDKEIRFDNLYFGFAWSSIKILLVWQIPLIVVFSILMVLFRKHLGFSVSVLFRYFLIATLPFFTISFFSFIMVHNDCVYENKTYSLGTDFPDDQCREPGTGKACCKCSSLDGGNYWSWMCGG